MLLQSIIHVEPLEQVTLQLLTARQSMAQIALSVHWVEQLVESLQLNPQSHAEQAKSHTPVHESLQQPPTQALQSLPPQQSLSTLSIAWSQSLSTPSLQLGSPMGPSGAATQQSGSAPSTAPSQSLSTPSLQLSASGPSVTQIPFSKSGSSRTRNAHSHADTSGNRPVARTKRAEARHL